MDRCFASLPSMDMGGCVKLSSVASLNKKHKIKKKKAPLFWASFSPFLLVSILFASGGVKYRGVNDIFFARFCENPCFDAFFDGTSFHQPRRVLMLDNLSTRRPEGCRW